MSPRGAGWAVATCAWLVGLVAGIAHYRAYASRPGDVPVRSTPEHWPAESTLRRDADGLTVIMFVHPDCACTRVSLDELEAAVRAGGKARVLVVLRSTDSDVAARIGRIPGAVSLVDAGEAARFGAATSGYTVAYDRAGALKFAGGITGSRGQAGRNVGGNSLRALLAGEPPRVDQHAVFGCGLGAS